MYVTDVLCLLQQDPYQEIRTLALGDESILSIALQPSEEKILCYTASNRLLIVTVPPMEIASHSQQAMSVADFRMGGFHKGPVVGMTISVQRPLIITIGADHTARVWNYLQVTK